MISSEMPTRVCLFGKPALYVAGTIRPFGGPRKAIALLAYLMQHSGRSVSRAAVSELFWPDEDDEDARAALRRHLYRAMSALPTADPKRPWVIADKVRMRWNPDAPIFIDTHAFTRLTDEHKLEAAVDLYRGDYLEDFHDDWVMPERERLRSLQSASLLELVERRRRALDYPAAISYAQSLLRLDSLREDAIRRIMSLRFAAGDRSGALADFEAFRRRLHDELATDPMPETIALQKAIRNNDDANPASTSSATDVRSARPAFPFIGRESALAAMRRAWESAARGPAIVAIVTGEAGIGKSRLIGEAIAIAESQGGRVMVGTTRPVESEPYQAIAEALHGALALIQFDRLQPMQVAALASLVPRVRSVAPNITELIALEPESDRRRLFDAVASAFQLIAKKRPLFVVFEDLHWAGSATVAMLDFLLRNAGSSSMLIVASFREEDVAADHPLRSLLRRLDSPPARHVALGPLEAEEVRALVAGQVSEHEQLADDIFAASRGNALFATELLRERLAGAGSAALPRGIATTVEARLDRLTPTARSLVETAAVTGLGFDVEVLRQASGWSFAEVFDAIDELLDRALVRESMQRRGDFAFSHQLVHAAVYAGIDDLVRRGLHRRIGRTLNTLFSNSPSLNATIARHYDAAGLIEDAVAMYLSSARYALAVFAQDDAVALTTRALELGATERNSFELHRLREEAAERAGNSVLRRFDAAAMSNIAAKLADDELLGVAHSRSFDVSLLFADQQGAAAAIDGLRAISERATSRRWGVEAALTQARWAVHLGNHRDADEFLCEVEEQVGALDDALAVRYWNYRAFNASWTDPVRARHYITRSENHIGEDQLLALSVLRIKANIFDVEGDARSLRTTATEMLDRYGEIGDIGGQAMAHRNLASAAWYAFDLKAESEHTNRAMEIFERIDKPNAVAAMHVQRGNSALVVGDFASSEFHFTRARALFETISSTGNACSVTRCLANLAWFRGDHGLSRDLALAALATAREHHIEREETNALSQLGAAERDLGLMAEASEHLEASLQWYRGRDRRQVLETLIDLIPVYLSQGEGHRALNAATELLESVERDSTAVGFPAQALAAAASAFEAAGRLDRSTALMSRARVIVHELADRIDDEASRRGYLKLRVHRALFADNQPQSAFEMGAT